MPLTKPDPRQPHSISLLRVIPCLKIAKPGDPIEPTCHLLQFTADKSVLDAWKKVTILDPLGNSRVFDAPAASGTPAPGKAALDPKLVTPVVRQGQIRNVTYTGQSLNLAEARVLQSQRIWRLSQGPMERA